MFYIFCVMALTCVCQLFVHHHLTIYGVVCNLAKLIDHTIVADYSHETEIIINHILCALRPKADPGCAGNRGF